MSVSAEGHGADDVGDVGPIAGRPVSHAAPTQHPVEQPRAAPSVVERRTCRFWKTRIGGASASPTNDQASCSFRIVSSTPSELVVISPLKDWACSSCGGTGDLLIMDDSGPLCMQCAELDHLVFLPSGDAALTRRARRDSRLSTVVVRFSRARGRYERQGVLVEEAALEQAETDCLADQPARARRRERDAARRANQDLKLQDEMAAAITKLYPGCPTERAHAIAQHAAARGSGRVGRSASGRALKQQALQLAVTASVRHQDTPYDNLLMRGVDRSEARELVRDAVNTILDAWRQAERAARCTR
jgi:hypothetical protein